MEGLSHQIPQRPAPPSGNKRCFNVNPQLHLLNFKHTLQQITCLHLLVVLPGSYSAGQARMLMCQWNCSQLQAANPALPNHFHSRLRRA